MYGVRGHILRAFVSKAPALWPSQRSCRNRNRSSVNAEFASTLVMAVDNVEKIMHYLEYKIHWFGVMA